MTPAYTLLQGEAAYRQACDTVLTLAERELLIFDSDLAALRLEERLRHETLAGFLRKANATRLRIVVHDPGPAQRNAPRLLRLIALHSGAMEIRQSPDNLRHLADTHIIADGCHAVRRFHVEQPRCALTLDDPEGLRPWRMRFDELWELSHPCLAAATTGL